MYCTYISHLGRQQREGYLNHRYVLRPPSIPWPLSCHVVVGDPSPSSSRCPHVGQPSSPPSSLTYLSPCSLSPRRRPEVGEPSLPLRVGFPFVAVFTMVASEHKISEQWDEAIETGIKRMAYGLAGGAVAALVLFRT